MQPFTSNITQRAQQFYRLHQVFGNKAIEEAEAEVDEARDVSIVAYEAPAARALHIIPGKFVLRFRPLTIGLNYQLLDGGNENTRSAISYSRTRKHTHTETYTHTRVYARMYAHKYEHLRTQSTMHISIFITCFTRLDDNVVDTRLHLMSLPFLKRCAVLTAIFVLYQLSTVLCHNQAYLICMHLMTSTKFNITTVLSP
jgi:hypothetical protein